MITLQPVSMANFDAVIALRVASTQRELVATNVESIAQAYVQPDCYPFAICADGEAVGFVMYCLDAEDNEYWLYRLMVDERHQRKGYAEAAMKLILAEIKKDAGRHKMYLGVDLSGAAAPELYKKLGFRFDGRVYGKEHIMLLKY